MAAALRLLVEDLQTEGWDAACEESLGDERLPTGLETAFYRVAQEALNNVRKHAGARKVRLALIREDGSVRLAVRDWGRGFPVDEGHEGGGPGERVGLSEMRERVSLLGGSFRVESRPGKGTRLSATLPLKAQNGEEHTADNPGRRTHP